MSDSPPICSGFDRSVNESRRKDPSSIGVLLKLMNKTLRLACLGESRRARLLRGNMKVNGNSRTCSVHEKFDSACGVACQEFSTYCGEQNLNQLESAIRRRFCSRVVPTLNLRTFPLSFRPPNPICLGRQHRRIVLISGQPQTGQPIRKDLARLMNSQSKQNGPLILSGRGVTAVLGPTNTGKTHLRYRAHGCARYRRDRPAAAASGA